MGAMGSADWCFFNDTAVIQAGAPAMVANETTVKEANAATDLADIFQGTNNADGFKMAQLIDFMLNDENRKEFLNETTNEALATRLRAEDAQVERARSELATARWRLGC